MDNLELNSLNNIRPRVKNQAISLFWPVSILFTRTLLFAIVQFLFIIIFGLSLNESAAWWPITAIIANIISFFILFQLAKKEGIRYRDLIHYDPKRLKQDLKLLAVVIPVAIIVGFGGMFGISYLMYGGGPPAEEMSRSLPLWAATIALILWPISNALVETPTYIGYALPRLEAFWNSRLLAISLPAIFLALQHLTLPITMDLKFMIWHAVSILPLAFAVALLYVKFRRLIPIMIVHYLFDVLAVIGLFLASMQQN